ncbi:hypothetical protein F5Y15DRAFT_370415 [Xylariaceae sp. FL0016]|nr:hypothetical protein F5Y15DRAFT_370415 [Xylariaceae sp. FL0016]
MQFTGFATLLYTLAALPSVLAMPTEVQGSATLKERQNYDGPCENTNCGVGGTDCTPRGYYCVPYPSFDAPEGCTCSAL